MVSGVGSEVGVEGLVGLMEEGSEEAERARVRDGCPVVLRCSERRAGIEDEETLVEVYLEAVGVPRLTWGLDGVEAVDVGTNDCDRKLRTELRRCDFEFASMVIIVVLLDRLITRCPEPMTRIFHALTIPFAYLSFAFQLTSPH